MKIQKVVAYISLFNASIVLAEQLYHKAVLAHKHYKRLTKKSNFGFGKIK